MRGRRRRHELLFLQLPYVSTASGTQTHPSSEHVGSLVLCFHTSAPSSEHLGSLVLCFRTSASSAAGSTDMLASGRLTGCYGHIERRLRGFLCPNPKQVCQLVEYSCDQAGVRPLPSPRGGHGNRIPALDLSGDYDESHISPLLASGNVIQVLYLDIKSRRFLLQYPTLTTMHAFHALLSSSFTAEIKDKIIF